MLWEAGSVWGIAGLALGLIIGLNVAGDVPEKPLVEGCTSTGLSPCAMVTDWEAAFPWLILIGICAFAGAMAGVVVNKMIRAQTGASE
jgi:hypothetical protein